MFLGVLLAQDSRAHESLRESKARLIDSQEQERRRIARELHDGIGQSLAMLQLELALLEPDCGPEAKTRLQSIGRQVTEVSSVAREISHGLHPSHLSYVGLRDALKELCRECGRDMSLNIDFSQSKIPESLAPEVSLSLYRVTQEALHNISKYSHAKNVGVRLRVMENALILEVQDDGVGFSVDHCTSTGIGISSMHERIESVGGRILIKSARMQGTKITASVPLNPILQKAA
jgi:Signal transduction histidine kinase